MMMKTRRYSEKQIALAPEGSVANFLRVVDTMSRVDAERMSDVQRPPF